MSLALTGTKTALGPKCIASFLGTGGTAPYNYAVLAGGAGGSIDPVTGTYTAPASVQSDPTKLYDTVQVTDANAATATTKILVGIPLLLFCEVIQQELGLAAGRVFLWDQKIFQPTDNDLYIVVSVPSCKPFANSVKPDPTTGWAGAVQSVNILATLDLDIISRGSAARDRKEEVIMALNSIYAQKQQEGNGFYIGKLPPGGRFVNLSQIDGAAIPYRYRISVNLQYFVTKASTPDFFDTFDTPDVNTDPPTPKVFNPIDLDSLYIWLDAENVLKDLSGNVSQMNDISGNGRHFVQNNPAHQPTWVSSSQGGKPAVVSNGSQWLNCIGTAYPNTMSLFAVFKNATGAGYQGFMSNTDGPDDFNYSANALGFGIQTNGQFFVATSIFDFIAAMGTETHMLGLTRGTDGISTWWDGQPIFTGHGNVAPVTADLILLAGYGGTGQWSLQELIMLDSEATPTELNEIFGYLNIKYDL